MRNVLVRGAVAGGAAGLLTSIVAHLWVEPVLTAAIALEGPSDGAGPVGRETQKLLGMPLGFLLLGIALGLLFAVVYRRLPSAAPVWSRSVGLAAGGFTALALVPQLRYPANPPGVGDPATVGARTVSYLLAVVLGIAVVAGAYAALRTLRARGVPPSVRQVTVAVGAVSAVTVGYLLLPGSGDPVDAPAALVHDFRVRSLGLLVMLYTTLGTVFGLLTERTDQVQSEREHSTPAPA